MLFFASYVIMGMIILLGENNMSEPVKIILTVVGILAYFASGIILGIVAESMAKGKGYKGRPHLITCVLFNIFGFIGACALPDKKNNEKIVELLRSVNALLGGTEEEEEEEKAPVRTVKKAAPVEEEEEEETVYRPIVRQSAPQASEPPRPSRPVQNPYFSEPAAPSSQGGYFSSRVASESAAPAYAQDATAQVVYKDGNVCCSRCNGKIKLNATSCPSCGAKIVSSSNAGGLGYIKPLN